MKKTMGAAAQKRSAANGRVLPCFRRGLVGAVVGCGLFAACVPAEEATEEQVDARVFPKDLLIDGWYCGDRDLAPFEQCEEELALGESCASLGYTGGELRCAGCRFDVRDCVGNGCGDGILQRGEECDFGTFDSYFRTTHDPSPERGCTPDCRFAPIVCNDGLIAWPNEPCDGSAIVDPARYSRSEQLLSYEPESLGCDPETCQLDFRQAIPAVCGNSVLERDEYCENNRQGFVDEDGQRWECLRCQRVDSRSRCGDAAVQRQFGETCEPLSNAWSRWCDPEDRSLGQVACVDCQIDRSDCPPSAPDPDPYPEFDAEVQPPDEGDTLRPDASGGPHSDAGSESRPAASGCSVPASRTTGFGSGLLLLGLWAGRRRGRPGSQGE